MSPPASPTSTSASRQEHSALILKLYENRMLMHQLDTFLHTIQAIAHEKASNNAVVTEKLKKAIRTCQQTQAIAPGIIISNDERSMHTDTLLRVYQNLRAATDLRMGTLNVFLDSVSYFVTHKDVHLRDGMVSTKMVELVNRFAMFL